MRQLKIMMGLALCAALLTTGCPKDDSDSGTPGTDALPGTDAVPGTDMGATDAGPGTDTGTMGFDLTLNLTDLLGTTPVDMATVVIAEGTDLATPLGMGTTDAAGDVVVSLMGAVTTPVAISSAAMHVTTYHFLGVPVTMAAMDDINIISSNNLATYYTLAGQTVEAGEATIAGRVIDSTNGMPVANAVVTSSVGDVIYVIGGTPNTMATMTDASGEFGILNIPGGSMAAMVTADDGVIMGTVTLPAPDDSLVLAGVLIP